MLQAVSRTLELELQSPARAGQIVSGLITLVLQLAGKLQVKGIVPGHLKGSLCAAGHPQACVWFSCTRPGKVQVETSAEWEETAELAALQGRINVIVDYEDPEELKLLVEKFLQNFRRNLNENQA